MTDVLEDMRWLLERLKAEGDEDCDFRECKVTMAAIAEIEKSRAFIASLRPELARLNECVDRTIAANKLVADILNGDHTNG